MLKLTKDGRFVTEKWVPKKGKVKGYTEDKNISTLLEVLLEWNSYIYVEPESTVASLMMAVRDIEGYEKLGPMFQNSWMREFIEEAFVPAVEETNLIALVWSHVCELDKDPGVASYFNKEPKKKNKREMEKAQKDYFSSYLSMHGKTGIEQEHGDHWGVDFMPINQLMPLKIELDLNFKIFDKTPKDYKDWKYILEVNREWTLGEFLHCFFYEISWWGGPKGKKDKIEEIDQILENSVKSVSNKEFRELLDEAADQAINDDED